MKASVNPYRSLLEWIANDLILNTSRNHCITEKSSTFLRSLEKTSALTLTLGVIPGIKGTNRNLTI